MNQIPFSIPIVAALSSLVILLVVRFIDVFEREPYKLILVNFIFGVLAYLLSVISVSSIYTFLKIQDQISVISDKFIFIAILLSSAIMLLYQLIFSILSLKFFKNDFDTMPDYIIYFSTIGIGYNFGEVFFVDLLNKTDNQFLLKISEKLYFSSFFSGSTLPFLMAGIGAGIYLYQISKKRKDLERLGNLGFLFISFSVITQIIFYSMNYFTTVASMHSPSDFLNLVNQIKYFANNLSLTLLIASVGLAVLFDSYILSNFLEKVFLSSKNEILNTLKISYFINPLNYLSISKLKYFFPLKKNTNFDEKEIKTFAKLALKDFNDPKNSFLYIAEANQILSKN